MYRIHSSLSNKCCCVGCYCRYGQMTAGSYCYIGPQGIVHGTVVRNWGRVYLSIPAGGGYLRSGW